jgi:hypothetical protein
LLPDISPRGRRFDPCTAHSWVTAWRVAFWNDVPEAFAVTGYDFVERVDERRRAEWLEHASDGLRQPDFGQEPNAASGVTGNRGPVTENEPPAFEPGAFGHTCEQAAGLLIVQRKQCHFFASVEPGDDTRRAPAELSGAGIEHHRAKERGCRR